MILEYKNKSYSVNVDWLSFSVQLRYDARTITLSPPDGMTIEECTPTKVYDKRCIVNDTNGQKFFTCLWCPRNTMISSQLMLVEVANEYLYNDSMSLVYVVLKSMVECDFNNPSRLDLCCDFENGWKENIIIKGLFNGNYYVADKHEGLGWWHGARDPHMLSFGNKNSQFKWKLYNKSRELNVKPEKTEYDKPYIVEEWLDAGLNIYNVWRLEISMTGVSKFKMYERPIDANDIFDMPTMICLFFEQVERRFIIRKNEHHTRKSRDKIVELLPIKLDHVNLMPKDPTERNVYAGVTEFNNLVKQIKTSSILRLDTVCMERYIDIANIIVDRYGLNKHFVKVYGKTGGEMIQDAVWESNYYYLTNQI